MAEKVLAKAKAGEDFAQLAKQYSEDPNTRDKGGELPVAFARGTLMVREFDEVAFALKNNQVSDLVATKVGYHIIKILEKIPARRVPINEVDKDIRELLSIQAAQKQLPEYLAKLRAEAGVEILASPQLPR